MKKYTNNVNRNIVISIKEELNKANKKLSPNSKIFSEYKKTLKGLTQDQLENAIGHLLGDARIEQNKNNTGCKIKFEWGDVNKEYAFKVFEDFKPYILTEPRKQTRINKLGNTNVTWCFQTITHKDLNILGEMFLRNGKKSLNMSVFDYITPRVIGRWFMDDGGMNGNHSHGIQFNTQSFTLEEVNQLCISINENYDLNAWVVIKKGKPVINLPASKYTKFVKITENFIEDCIKHKLKVR